jgi:Ferritin-like
MAHFVAVRNVLRFVGGPLNFDREDLPFCSEFYPFPFQLAPLDEVRLARYVVAEMPASPHIDSDLLADVIARATGGGQAINRVGALYDRIPRLFAEEESLPDSVFRPDRVTGLQAAPSGFLADVGRRPLFVRTLDGRADALSVLADVASQREGESDVPDSHFLTFC